MSTRGLFVPHDAPWLRDFDDELLCFSAGVHDDQVDALGLIGQLLDRIRPGQAVNPAPKPKDAMSGYRSLRSAGSDSWRTR